MDYEIKMRLEKIEQLAEQIQCELHGIYGYCMGMETVARDYPSAPLENNLIGHGNQSKPTLLEEIREMIVELKIKGSVRERANGLIELRTKSLGSIYGRTKEEIETKLSKKLKETKKKEKGEFDVPTNFDAFALYWFNNFHKRKVCEKTYSHDIKLYDRHIKKRFEKLKIKTINAAMLQSFLDAFQIGAKQQKIYILSSNKSLIAPSSTD